MANFRTARPRGIAQSVATLLASSGQPKIADIMAVETARSNIDHRNSLAEKVRLQVEQMRESERLRRDPNEQLRYGAMGSGLDLATARQLNDSINGRDFQAESEITHDDEGNKMPPAIAARPENVTPEQERAFRSSIVSLMANVMGTGKTNADQLVHAGGRQQENMLRQQLSTPGLDPAARVSNIEAISGKAVTPYRTSSDGTTVTNQMTGAAEDTNTLIGNLARNLVGNKTLTEVSRQGLNRDRGTQARAAAGASSSTARVNDARIPLIQAQTNDIIAGRPRTFKPADPMQAEKRFSDMTVKEYDALDRKLRKTTTLQQYQQQRRAEIEARIKGNGAGKDFHTVLTDAQRAIAGGADAAAVKKRFKSLTGMDFPDGSGDDE